MTYAKPRGQTRAEIKDLDGLNLVTTTTYDGLDRPTVRTLPEGNKLAYAYDSRSNVVSVTATPKPGSPLAALTTNYEYEPTYNKPTKVDAPCCDPGTPGRQITTMFYEPLTGNLATVVRDWGAGAHFNATSKFTYSAKGQLLTATDPLGVVTRYAYDADGNQVSILRDEGGANLLTTTGYDRVGNAVSVTDPNGSVTWASYDANRWQASVTAPVASALETAFTHDADGRLVETRQSTGGAPLRTTRASYTPTGKLASATDANGNVTRTVYDLMDRLVELRDPAGRITEFRYDSLGRRAAVLNTAIQAAPLERRSYTPNSQLATLTDSIGTVTSYGYDGFDRLERTSYADASFEQNGYDLGGNLLTRRTRAGDTIAFAHDTLNRLTTKTPPSPAPVVSYRYDLTGRLTGVSDTGSTVAMAAAPTGVSSVAYTADYSYDALNRLTKTSFNNVAAAATPTPGSVSFSHGYNAVNQRVSQQATDAGWWYVPSALATQDTFSFGYDTENRLTAASGAGMSAAYAYDGRGRRKTKTVNGATTVFLTDPEDREVLEYDGASGVVQRWFVYGGGIDEVLAQVNVAATHTTSNPRLAMLPDILGSVTGTMDAGSAAIAKAGYSPFGGSSTTAGTYRYTGRRVDAETGGLYYYRARTYDPIAGRFLQADPIGYAGGLNRYAYVNNDPLNFVDPTGNILDAILDLAFIGYDVGVLAYDEIFNEGANRTSNLVALGADVAGLAIPFVTGTGPAYRAGNKLVDVARQADNAVPAGGSAQARGIAVHKEFDNLVEAGAAGRNVTGETAYIGGIPDPRYRPKGSVNPDATLGDVAVPKAAFDLKTGQSGIGSRQASRYEQNLPLGTPVFTVRPQGHNVPRPLTFGGVGAVGNTVYQFFSSEK